MPGAVHVRKVGIQVSDIVDFGTTSGVSKILAGAGISVSPASGVGAVTVSSTGVTKILAGTAITISPVSGVGDVTVSATAGVDVLRSPSGEDQAILPLTDNIPLTIKGFAGGASDVLDIFDSSNPQVLRWSVLPSGRLKGLSAAGFILLDPTGLAFGIGVPAIGFGATIADTFMQRAVIAGFPYFLLSQTKITSTGNTVTLKVSPSSVQSADLFHIDDLFGVTMFSVQVDGTTKIIPDNNTIPLTLKGFPTGTQDILDIFDSTSPTQILQIKVTSAGIMTFLNAYDVSAIAAPAAPAVNVRRVFVLSTQNQVAAKTSAGTLVYLEGRGAPNIVVAKSATSLSVTLSPAEPDTTYEIGTTPAFNSTVFYSAKATTGFTLNFGTAPAAASTLDWIVDRRVSGSA